MQKQVFISSRQPQKGFGIFAYILMAVVLLGVLVSAISKMSNNSAIGQENDILVAKIYSQASKIKSDIELCPTKIMNDVNNYKSDEGPAKYQTSFPGCDADPTSTASNSNITSYAAGNYCTGTTSTTYVYANASQLTCMKRASLSLWDSSDGSFFPEPNPIPGFAPWKYVIEGNSASPLNGVSLVLIATTTNVDIDWVLRKVQMRFGNNSSSIFRVTATGDTTFSNVAGWLSCVKPCLANALVVYLAKG
jgi:hypothetical protein